MTLLSHGPYSAHFALLVVLSQSLIFDTLGMDSTSIIIMNHDAINQLFSAKFYF